MIERVSDLASLLLVAPLQLSCHSCTRIIFLESKSDYVVFWFVIEWWRGPSPLTGHQGDFLTAIHRTGSKSSFFHCRSWAWRKLFLPWEGLETTVMQHWLLVFPPNTSSCFTRIFSCARWILSIWNPWPFLQLDRSPIIFQNRAWKLPHLWNLSELKGRAHSETTLVLSSTIWSWEVASSNPWLSIFYFLLILLASKPLFSWALIFFCKNILNETYNK